MSWTDERIAQLKRLVDDGLSARGIATALGGISRNGVIGKLRRLGLKFKSGAMKPKAPTLAKPKPGRLVVLTRASTELLPRLPSPPPRPVRPKSEAPELVMSAPISILDLEPTSCRWPIKDLGGGSHLFCGAKRVSDESSYCVGHDRLAH